MSKDYSLSLSGAAFDRLRNDFDTTLRDVLAGMIETEQNAAEINVKIKITLTNDSAPDYSVAGGYQTREVTKPRFDHTVTYVIQRKEKKNGSFSGNYELVYDRNSGLYYYRDIDSGQTSIFESDEQTGGYVDAEHSAIEEDPRGLPAAPESDSDADREDVPEDGDGSVPDAAEEFAEGSTQADSTETPFGWLCQFIGEKLRVTESLGNYTVRTAESNRVVLSSATGPDSPFYCAAEKLEPHVGHEVFCVGYGQPYVVSVSIECEDCDTTLFSLGYLDGEENGDEEPAGEDTDSYNYEAPEE